MSGEQLEERDGGDESADVRVRAFQKAPQEIQAKAMEVAKAEIEAEAREAPDGDQPFEPSSEAVGHVAFGLRELAHGPHSMVRYRRLARDLLSGLPGVVSAEQHYAELARASADSERFRGEADRADAAEQERDRLREEVDRLRQQRERADRERDRAREEADRLWQPTHICLDCGAVGWAGSYHDHGNGNAGDTATIASVLAQLGEHDEQRERAERAEAEAARYRDLYEQAAAAHAMLRERLNVARRELDAVDEDSQ